LAEYAPTRPRPDRPRTTKNVVVVG
jgi:hypothetical protein